MSSHPTTPVERWHALDRFHREVGHYLDRSLRMSIGLTAREFAALEAVAVYEAETGLPPCVSEVAEAIGLSQSATSRLTARLQDRSLVGTQIRRTDTRVSEVRLAGAAHRVLAEGRQAYIAALNKALFETLLADSAQGRWAADLLNTEQMQEPPRDADEPETMWRR